MNNGFIYVFLIRHNGIHNHCAGAYKTCLASSSWLLYTMGIIETCSNPNKATRKMFDVITLELLISSCAATPKQDSKNTHHQLKIHTNQCKSM